MIQRRAWPKAVLFDLDDTLWPIAPVILEAEQILFAWLREHAPRVAQQFTIETLRQARLELLARQPEFQLDLGALRRAGLIAAFEQAAAQNMRFPSQQPQKIIANAAQMLSSLSQFAGVVQSPRRESVFQQIEFLRLSEKRILLVIVDPRGDVQNRLLLTDVDYTPGQLTQSANYLNQNYAGLTFDEVRARLSGELRQLRDDMGRLMQVAVEAGSEAMAEGDDMVIAGERNLLSVSDLSSNMTSLRQMFEMFEQKTGLMQLLEVSSKAGGVQIFIGGESKLVPMDEMSVVTAPYEVNGRIVGTLGVIGPTRMAYERVIPIVDITAKLLSNALSQS